MASGKHCQIVTRQTKPCAVGCEVDETTGGTSRGFQTIAIRGLGGKSECSINIVRDVFRQAVEALEDWKSSGIQNLICVGSHSKLHTRRKFRMQLE